jgi:hypothetical protein
VDTTYSGSATPSAQAHIRNIHAEDTEEPKGFASVDMKKFLENPDSYEIK